MRWQVAAAALLVAAWPVRAAWAGDAAAAPPAAPAALAATQAVASQPPVAALTATPATGTSRAAEAPPPARPAAGPRLVVSTAGERAMSFIGIFVFLGIAYLLSDARRRINWRTVGTGMAMQLVIAALVLKTGGGREVFGAMNGAITHLIAFTDAGASFVFGHWPDVFGGTDVLTGQPAIVGFVFAFKVLPVLIFVSSLFSVLYYLGILQIIVRGVAWVMYKVMGVSGAEALGAAANIFMGMTEAPLVIRPYLGKMTRSEILSLMVSGMATIAGSVLVAYVGMGVDGAHLLAASFMSAPGALVVAKMLMPESGTPETLGVVRTGERVKDANVIDAAARGASEGVALAINVGGMLIAFIALIALVNGLLGFVGGTFNSVFGTGIKLSLEAILAILGAPIAFFMGVPWDECARVGVLIGQKTVLNEFVAYQTLGTMVRDAVHPLSARAEALATYALCGFANFGSIAILLGGLSVLAPERRQDLAECGILSLAGGSLACFITACIAGVML